MSIGRDNLYGDFITFSTRFFLDFKLIPLNRLWLLFSSPRLDPFSPGVGDIT